MARPNLMYRYDLDPGEVIGFEILFELVRREPGIGWRDVVEGLRRAPLQRAGRVQCGRGRRALETRRLLDFWQDSKQHWDLPPAGDGRSQPICERREITMDEIEDRRR